MVARTYGSARGSAAGGAEYERRGPDDAGLAAEGRGEHGEIAREREAGAASQFGAQRVEQQRARLAHAATDHDTVQVHKRRRAGDTPPERVPGATEERPG